MKHIYYLMALILLLFGTFRTNAQCTGGTPQCQILIEMHDSYGDGWNNGQLYVYQGSTLRGTVTLNDGSSGDTTISVCSDSVTFVWSVGSWGEEVSFEVTNEDGDTLLAVNDVTEYSTGDTIAVVMNQCPTCPRPSGLHVVTRTHNQLALAWNASSSSSWLVE